MHYVKLIYKKLDVIISLLESGITHYIIKKQWICFYERHWFPQLQDLVNRYKPDLIWADGPDQINDKQWQAERTLGRSLSESPVKDSIVVNDRCANNTGKITGEIIIHEDI